MLPARFIYCACACFIAAVTGCLSGRKNLQTNANDTGKVLFESNCLSCHSLTNDGIGPRLGGVTRLRSEKNLIDFIQDPAKAVASGETRTRNLVSKYKMVMPAFGFLSEKEIKAIINYIDAETREGAIEPMVVEPPTADQADRDRRSAKPITKSGLRVELENYVQIPPSSDLLPKARIATVRADPSQNGILYVSDQRGVIHRISGGKTNVFLDVQTLVSDFINKPGLGTGLGSFVFHPDYQQNGLIYITHTEAYKGKKADYSFSDSIKVALQWVVTELKVNSTSAGEFAGSRREVLRVDMPSSVHGIQDIGFAPKQERTGDDHGLLYIGIGDGGATVEKHPELTHTMHSLLGTIIRIDPLDYNASTGKKYGIPKDNPFVGNTDPRVRKEIYAYGFRNPHRLSWYAGDRLYLFCSDVGEANFEELNVVEKGKDYGWNTREGNYGISVRDLKNVYDIPKTDQYVPPFAGYSHLDGSAISGGYVYTGNVDVLKNKYIFGDIANGRLFYVSLDKTLSDSTIHELTIIQNGRETDLRKLCKSERVDLRIGYDPYKNELFIMTKTDGMIRRVTKAYFN